MGGAIQMGAGMRRHRNVIRVVAVRAGAGVALNVDRLLNGGKDGHVMTQGQREIHYIVPFKKRLFLHTLYLRKNIWRGPAFCVQNPSQKSVYRRVTPLLHIF